MCLQFVLDFLNAHFVAILYITALHRSYNFSPDIDSLDLVLFILWVIFGVAAFRCTAYL